MRLSRVLPAILLVASLPALAQTYTPKDIRMEGAPDTDSAELLRIAKLTPGKPITVPEIQAALQRLGDTGMFTDIRYSVDSNALVFKLTPAPSSQFLHARFANFVWWPTPELEKLVEARVPGFHGSLPASGTLTDQVEAALVALLREKGIDATINAIPSAGNIALSIAQPRILLGEIHLANPLPELAASLTEREHTLSKTDLDIIGTASSLREYLSQVFQDAGYLDITIDKPTYSAPRKGDGKEADAFLVDATTTAHPNELYHLTTIDLPPTPPIPASEITQAAILARIKPGAPASASGLRLAQAEIARACQDHGYLDATARAQPQKDPTAHTMAYTFTITLGEIYHLASIDISAFTPDQQQVFQRSAHITPGAVVDKNLSTSIGTACGNSISPTHPGSIAAVTAPPTPQPSPSSPDRQFNLHHSTVSASTASIAAIVTPCSRTGPP